MILIQEYGLGLILLSIILNLRVRWLALFGKMDIVPSVFSERPIMLHDWLVCG